MITFIEFIIETFLMEMPHIELSNNKAVDLELEVHTKMKPDDFLSYISRWLNGDNIKSKTPGIEMHVNNNNVTDFAKKMLKNYFFRVFVIKNYGIDVWEKLVTMITDKIKP